MKIFYISYWRQHKNETLIIKSAKNIDDLYVLLSLEYPEIEILIHEYNFNYINNITHHTAAAFPIDNPSIANALSPAHFNRDFFFILTSVEANI